MLFRKLLASLFIFPALASAAETQIELDGTSGNIFQVDLNAKQFEFLKETEYDPKTGIGKSRFTIHWSDQTTITSTSELKNFSSIKGPIIASFHGINDTDAAALKAGKPFVARIATLFAGAGEEAATGPTSDFRKVTAWFTPSQEKESRSGKIKTKDQEIEVKLRQKFWRIFHHQPLKPADLTKGFWKATLKGKQVGDRFIAESIEVQTLPDPRESDDPKLPRVLVIGDSISMNYHEAAKSELKGIANYHRNEGNSFSSIHGVNNAELWLGNYDQKGFQWDVIQFNHGLHDLKQAYDAKTDTFGAYAMPIADYQKNLEKLIGILRKTGAKLIWCSTTPVPRDIKSKYARRKGASKDFNEAALEVMKRHPDILITDLYSAVTDSPTFDKWRTGKDVHFYTPEEQKALSEAVAKTVKESLSK